MLILFAAFGKGFCEKKYQQTNEQKLESIGFKYHKFHVLTNVFEHCGKTTQFA